MSRCSKIQQKQELIILVKKSALQFKGVLLYTQILAKHFPLDVRTFHSLLNHLIRSEGHKYRFYLNQRLLFDDPEFR